MPKTHFLGHAHYIDNSMGKCPVCNYQLDGASGLDHNDKPEPDDIGVCIKCAAALSYNADMTLRVMPQSEISGLSAANQRLIRLAMVAVRASNHKPK